MSMDTDDPAFRQRMTVVNQNQIRMAVLTDDKYPADDFSMERFWKDSRADLNFLFEKYYKILCLFACRFVKDERVAEEIAGDTFFKLWKLRETFNSLKNVEAFLFLTTKNACIDYCRKVDNEKKNKKALLNFLLQEGYQYVDTMLISTEDFTELSRQIELLPPDCKLIFQLLYFQKLETGEVAEKLGKTAR